jgi:hypothetical protein
MFQASFMMPSFGNDTSTGTINPFNTYGFTGIPLGKNCQNASQYLTSISTYYPAPHYCGDTTMQAGVPVTGAGTLTTGTLSTQLVVGASVPLPSKAFAVGDWLGGHYTWTTSTTTPSGMGKVWHINTGTGTSITPSTHMYGGFTTPIDARNGGTGFLAIYYPYLQSHTYATLHNVAGNFFAGGGPAASGTVTRTGKAKRVGSWVVTPGANALGGAMGILGRLGAHGKYVVPGQPGTYEGSTSWNMVKALGRTWGTAMKRADSMNPYTNTGTFYNPDNLVTSVLTVFGTGSAWTTGMVSLYGNAGYFETILRRTGFDTTTGTGTMKVRNIQLVTPALTHWQGVFVNSHTGHVGMLNLQLVPEPGAALLLATGGGVLTLLYRANRRG